MEFTISKDDVVRWEKELIAMQMERVNLDGKIKLLYAKIEGAKLFFSEPPTKEGK